MSDAKNISSEPEASNCQRICLASVTVSDNQRDNIRRRAETAALTVGVSEDAWRAYRAKAPFARDVLMLADPIGERDRIQQETS